MYPSIHVSAQNKAVRFWTSPLCHLTQPSAQKLLILALFGQGVLRGSISHHSLHVLFFSNLFRIFFDRPLPGLFSFLSAFQCPTKLGAPCGCYGMIMFMQQGWKGGWAVISPPGALVLGCWPGLGWAILNGTSVETGKANTSMWASLALGWGRGGGGPGAWVRSTSLLASAGSSGPLAFWTLIPRCSEDSELRVRLSPLGDTFAYEIFPCSSQPPGSALPA